MNSIGQLIIDTALPYSGNAGVLFSQTSSKTVTNSTTETSIIGTGIGTMTLPANFWTVGRIVRINFAGIFSTAAIPGNLTIKIKLGSVVIASGIISNIISNAANASFNGIGKITCRSTGSSGTVVINGILMYSAGNLLPYNSLDLNNAGATSTIDTTASQLFDITDTFATASTSNIITCTDGLLESLN